MTETEKIEKEYAEKLAVAKRKDALKPKLLGNPAIFFSGYHGSVGFLSYKVNNEFLTQLVQYYPAIDKYFVGGNSFRTTGEVRVNPYTVTLDPNWFSQSVKVKWFTIIDGEVFEIWVEYPLKLSDFGLFTINTYCNPKTGDIEEVRYCNFKQHSGHCIKWATGGDKTLNSFTLYWDAGTPVPEFFRSIQ